MAKKNVYFGIKRAGGLISIRMSGDEPDSITVTRDQFEELKKDFPLECAEIERTLKKNGGK